MLCASDTYGVLGTGNAESQVCEVLNDTYLNLGWLPFQCVILSEHILREAFVNKSTTVAAVRAAAFNVVVFKKQKQKSEPELTASILKKDPKHKRD